MTTHQALRFIVKPVVFVAALGPVAWLTWAGLTGNLSVNPLSDLIMRRRPLLRPDYAVVLMRRAET